MPSSKHFFGALFWVPVFAFAQSQQAPMMGQPSLPGSAQSTSSAPALAPSHAMTVEALLVLDSQIAMDKLNAQAAKAAPPPPVSSGPSLAAAAPAPEKIEVLSILGIGGDKKVTLLINGKRYTQLTEGAKAGSYVVQSVGGGCVTLVPASAAKGKSKSAKSQASKARSKRTCFDPDAEDEMLAGGGMALGQPSGGGIQTRMTIAPLPLPVVPAPMAVRVNPQ